MATATEHIHDEVRELIRRRGIDPVADQRATRPPIDEVITHYEEAGSNLTLPPLIDRPTAARFVFDALAGFGPLQRYLEDSDVEEIWINEPGRVFVCAARSVRAHHNSARRWRGQGPRSAMLKLSDASAAGLVQPVRRRPAPGRIPAARGDHFSSGLDLSELTERDATEGLQHSQMWHRVFDRIQYCRVPVIAALKGAVIGGGLELACAAHIRVAEPSAYFALPEGQRGIFVGGGGSVRLPRLIGVARMTDMMLTGRVYSATEGSSYGFAQYLIEEGGALPKAMELAEKIADNAPLTNFAVLQALPMIAEANPQTGLLMESLMATVAQSDKEAKRRIRAFLDRKTAKVKPT